MKNNEVAARNMREIKFKIIGTAPYVPKPPVRVYKHTCTFVQDRADSLKNNKGKHMKTEKPLLITRPNIETTSFNIIGDAPYVQNRMSKKALEDMAGKMTQETKMKGGKRPPRDFEAEYHAAMHVSSEGWCGIPAPGFRAAMVSACRLISLPMTKAKLSVFIVPDGFDKIDQLPLVQITKGNPHQQLDYTKIQQTTNVVARPAWEPGWEATVRIRYDADMLSGDDVANLLARVGMQVGLGCGRPDSKQSTGLGWGTFLIEGFGENYAN